MRAGLGMTGREVVTTEAMESLDAALERHVTPAGLRELATFSRTPLGAKAARLTCTISEAALEVAQPAVFV
jgi:hypothetical protein